METSVAVTVKSHKGKQTSGEVTVLEWTKNERLKRALKVWAAGWGAGIVSVIIPVAHFILVPLFILGTPIVAIVIYRQQSLVKGGASQCPECGSPLPLEKGPDKWPLSDLCTKCSTSVTIEKT